MGRPRKIVADTTDAVTSAPEQTEALTLTAEEVEAIQAAVGTVADKEFGTQTKSAVERT